MNCKYILFRLHFIKPVLKFYKYLIYIFTFQQNGNVVMGVPLGYMDFAPEPPAPTATPVISTEVNCTPSNDTKDLSSEYQSESYRCEQNF